MLRDLVGKAQIELEARFPKQITPATLGGSFGIWRVTAPAKDLAEALPKIRAALATDAAEHLGFGLVAVADDGKGFSHQRKRLRAALQHARLTEVRLPYPDLNDVETGAEAGVCPVDFLRPIGKDTGRKIDKNTRRHTSRAVFARRDFGMKAKQTLIAEETLLERLSDAAKAAKARTGWPMAMQIASISESNADHPLLKTNLHDKICVISLDGNGFGKIQDFALAHTADELKTQKVFDETLKRFRGELVSDVFDLIISQGCEGAPCEEEVETRIELRKQQAKVIRFELLLWGGDEIMFIVPARVGWRVMEKIGASVGKMQFDPAALGLGQVNLSDTDKKRLQKVTFSVGAVFCHQTAPIARVKRLADNLCDHIKTLKKSETGDGRNGKADTLFMVEVLESFDHIGMDLNAHLAKRMPYSPGKPTENKENAFSKATRDALRVLDLAEVNALRKVAEALARGKGGDISRGMLRQTAFTLHRGKAQGAEFAGEKWAKYVQNSANELEHEAKAFAKDHFGIDDDNLRDLGQARLFTLLEEYWDYLTPEKQPEDQAESSNLAEVAI